VPRRALRVAHSTGAQPFDQDDEDLLDKVLRSGRITKVSEAIEPDPRCEPPIELRLLFLRGPWRGGRDCVGEHCIGGGGEVRGGHTTDRTNRISPPSRSP
jgi:hypothetical protein